MERQEQFSEMCIQASDRTLEDTLLGNHALMFRGALDASITKYYLDGMRKPKQEVFTFKADAKLRKALAGIHNRSAFIRTAILDALASTCPFCGGSGILSAAQKAHWKQFMRGHTVEECQSCHALTVVCRPARRASQAKREQT